MSTLTRGHPREFTRAPVVVFGFQRGPAAKSWSSAWFPFDDQGVELPLWLLQERIFGADPNEKVSRTKAIFRTVRFFAWKLLFACWLL